MHFFDQLGCENSDCLFNFWLVYPSYWRKPLFLRFSRSLSVSTLFSECELYLHYVHIFFLFFLLYVLCNSLSPFFLNFPLSSLFLFNVFCFDYLLWFPFFFNALFYYYGIKLGTNQKNNKKKIRVHSSNWQRAHYINILDEWIMIDCTWLL